MLDFSGCRGHLFSRGRVTVFLAFALTGCGAGNGTLRAMPDGSAHSVPVSSGRRMPVAGSAARPGAAKETVLHSFQGTNDGANPYSTLIFDKKGALFGTTTGGGTKGGGTVFKLTPSGSRYAESILYSFYQYRTDGISPYGGLVLDKYGSLYGTTLSGGYRTLSGCNPRCGTVYKLARSKGHYSESQLYVFQGNPQGDGSYPRTGLIMDKAGALFGTTETGGSRDDGTVFGLGSAKGPILHSFDCRNDGANPVAKLFADTQGALFGTTQVGGGGNRCQGGYGIVFNLTPSASGYNYAILYSFQGSPDGASPSAGLIGDKQGTLYGTTASGGTGSCQNGCGTVFKLTRSGSGYAETVIYNFQGGSDGANPQADLLRDTNGDIFGTTVGGGGSSACSGGCGTIFELMPSGTTYTESVLYSFRGTPDGAEPQAGLVADKSGNLYGTTVYGGTKGYGTVFKLTP